MTIVRKADGDTGTVAIYTGGDDAPFDDPVGNLSRVRFHSGLYYPSIVSVLSGTLSLGAIPNPNTGTTGSVITTDTNVGAHGQAGPPMVFGDIVIGGQRISICGMVPVTNIFDGTGYAGTLYHAWGRFLELVVDGSYAYIRATTLMPTVDVPGASTVPAFSGAYNIYVTDLNLSSPNPVPPLTDSTLLEEPNLVQYGRGRFRSDRRFMRASSVGTQIKFARAATYGWNVEFWSGGSGTGPRSWAFTWNVAGQTRQMKGVPYGSGSLSGPGFAASVQDARV